MFRLALLAVVAISVTIPAECNTSIPPICGAVSDRNIPHPSSCSQYIACRSASTNIESCPSGFIFHPNMQVCTPGNPATCKFTPENDICGVVGSYGQHFPIPDQQQCKEYMQCYNGYGFLTSCPDGTALRPRFLDCVPANECCETYAHICSGLGNQFIRHPARCDMYVSCLSEVAHVVPCRRGEIFYYGRCVPGSAKNCVAFDGLCSDRVDGFIRHPDSCDMYFSCRGGVTVVEECPYGYIFSSVLQRCISGHALGDTGTCREPEL
ncbi:hypothetical protein RP20_CCG016067 [Aedes albopictus]|nr:hypothetical protein RP20_CCG016067 [Aedes albopictus]